MGTGRKGRLSLEGRGSRGYDRKMRGFFLSVLLGLAASATAAPEARGAGRYALSPVPSCAPLSQTGVPAAAARALEAFASDPTLYPQGATPPFHGAAQTRRLIELSAAQAATAGLSPRRKTLVAAAAALHAIDPDRAPGTLPRAQGASLFQASDPRALELLGRLETLRFDGEPEIPRAQVQELAAAMGPAWSRQAADRPATAGAAFVGEDAGWAEEWIRRLRFLRQAEPLLGSTVDAQNRLALLAAETRATASLEQGRAVGSPSDDAFAAAAFEALSALPRAPFFEALPERARGAFKSTLTLLEIFHGLGGAPEKESAPPAEAPPRSAAPLEGTLTRLSARGNERLKVVFARPPERMESTFLLNDAGGRLLALKTARYVGIKARGPRQMAALLTQESHLLRRAGEISREPGFPDNVGVAEFLGYAQLSPELTLAIYGDTLETAGLLLRGLPGRTLYQHFSAGGSLDARDFDALIAAYRRLHRGGVLHGDPNMGNIMITRKNGRQSFSLLDFNSGKDGSEVDGDTWRGYTHDELASLEDIREFFRDAGRLVGEP